MKVSKTFVTLILATAAVCIAGCQPATDAGQFDISQFELVDLTHTLNSEAIYWPTDTKGFVITGSAGETPGGFFYAANAFSSAEHGGTHLDAPYHFSASGQKTDEIPLSRLIGKAVVVDVSSKSAADRDYQINVSDLTNWESVNGPIPDNSIVLFRTGYGEHWPNRELYLGTAETGPEAVPQLHFPGIEPTAASWIVENRKIASVGIDTPSIDFGQSALFETHQILFAENIPAFENVANLEALPEVGALVFAMPAKIGGGSGGPLRIVALIPKSR